MRSFRFKIADDHVPSLLAAMEELGDTLATRAEEKDTFPREAALTRAIAAIGPIRASLYNAVRAIADERRALGLPEASIPDGPDPDFPTEKK